MAQTLCPDVGQKKPSSQGSPPWQAEDICQYVSHVPPRPLVKDGAGSDLEHPATSATAFTAAAAPPATATGPSPPMEAAAGFEVARGGGVGMSSPSPCFLLNSHTAQVQNRKTQQALFPRALLSVVFSKIWSAWAAGPRCLARVFGFSQASARQRDSRLLC